MSAEGWAGFAWVLAIWDQTVLELLAATSPIFDALAGVNLQIAGLVSGAWLILITCRLAEVRFLRGLVAGMIMFPIIAVGLSRATITLPGGGEVQATEIQRVGFGLAMGIHSIYSAALNEVLSKQTVAGSILPAQAAMDRAVGRSAALYEGSDLAQLIRDYNASCAPRPSEIAGPQNVTKIEALHAIGLMGGGGLGIPEDEVSLLAQASTGAEGLMNWITGASDIDGNGGFLSYVMGGAARIAMNEVVDMRAIQERRDAGLEYLQSTGPFEGGRYALPTQAHWQAVFSGKQDDSAGYLPITMIEGQKSQLVTEETTTTFQPSSCADAYKIAQLGAEQAYKAMKTTGKSMPGGQSVSAEASTIAAAGAWQKFLSQSMENTGMQKGNAEVVGGVLSGVQWLKNLSSWFDLQTIIPGYIVANAWLFVIVLVAGPFFLLLAPLRGFQALSQWAQLLLFCVLTMVFLHILVIGLSQAVAASAFTQSATAAGWQGGAPDDAVRGSTGLMGAMLLSLTTWICFQLTGVNVSALAGSMSGAVSTATGVANMAGSAISFATKAGKVAKIAGGTLSKSGGNGKNGTPGSDGGSAQGQSAGSIPSSVKTAFNNAKTGPAASRSTNRLSPLAGSDDGYSLNPAKPKSS
jgi:hypothetical protein